MEMLKVNKQCSLVKVDIMIPVIEKDLKTLPFVIDSLREKVLHPIGSIYVVAPISKKIQKVCNQKQCQFVDESTVLPFSKKEINYRVKQWDGSGWLLQQFLKLSVDNICQEEHCLVMDADTLLIRPHLFVFNGKPIFYCRNWSRKEYFRTYKKLLGKRATSSLSFVAHYMLFEKSKLSQLKRQIEIIHKMPWYEAIQANMNKKKRYSFSEFETYGNYLYSKDPSSFFYLPANNKRITSSRIFTKSRLNKMAEKYNTLSLHNRKFYLK